MSIIRQVAANITPRQLEVLSHISRKDRWLVGEVALELGVSSAAATKAILRLERKGLVTRTVDMLDRRRVNVCITRAGNAIVQRVPDRV